MDNILFEKLRKAREVASSGPGGTQSSGYDNSIPELSAVTLPKPVSKQIPLPTGSRMTQQPRPTPRTDLVEMIHLSNETIYNLMGVPKSILSNDSSIRGNAEGMNKTMEKTLSTMRSLVSSVLTSIYNKIYGESERAHRANKVVKTLSKAIKDYDENTAISTIHDNFVNRDIHRRLELIIQAPPSTDPNELFEAHKRGLVSYEQLHFLTTKAFGIQSSVNVKELSPPLIDEEMKHVILMSYGISGEINGSDKVSNNPGERGKSKKEIRALDTKHSAKKRRKDKRNKGVNSDDEYDRYESSDNGESDVSSDEKGAKEDRKKYRKNRDKTNAKESRSSNQKETKSKRKRNDNQKEKRSTRNK